MSSLLAGSLRAGLLWSVIVVTFTGCGHEPVRRLPDGGSATTSGVKQKRGPLAGEQAALVAVGQVGTPYRYGGNSIRGFDCSGLVQFAWSRAGVRLPRTTAQQWKTLSPARGRELRAGDLLFFRIDGTVSHVGLYLGDRRFVHAPSSGREVSIESLDAEFYRRAFAGSARPRVDAAD